MCTYVAQMTTTTAIVTPVFRADIALATFTYVKPTLSLSLFKYGFTLRLRNIFVYTPKSRTLLDLSIRIV